MVAPEQLGSIISKVKSSHDERNRNFYEVRSEDRRKVRQAQDGIVYVALVGAKPGGGDGNVGGTSSAGNAIAGGYAVHLQAGADFSAGPE